MNRYQVVRRRRTGRGYTRPIGQYGRYSKKKTGCCRKPELKYQDIDAVFTAPAGTNTGIVSSSVTTGQVCVSIKEGTGHEERVGRKIKLHSIHLKGDIFFNPAASVFGHNIFYLWLILDTQANGTQPAFTDVFVQGGPQECFKDLSNGNRFKVLWKKAYVYNAQAGVSAAYAGQYRNVDIYKRVDKHIEYAEGTGIGDLIDIKENNLFFAWGQREPLLHAVAFDGKIRRTWYD